MRDDLIEAAKITLRLAANAVKGCEDEDDRAAWRLVAAVSEDYLSLRKENSTMQEALRAIVLHQEAIGGGLAVLSATRQIAQMALDATVQDGP